MLEVLAGLNQPVIVLCTAWTATRVLLSVEHEMGARCGVWCVAVPRSPSTGLVLELYDHGDPSYR